MDDALIREVIDRCNLGIGLDQARGIAAAASAPLAGLSVEDRNIALLLLECFVRKAQGGHRVTVTFGHSDAGNNPRCIVCKRAVDETGWSLRIISRWDNTQLWITWHDICLGHHELEFDYDLLTGDIVSPVGFH
jgi:hypothetical protein